MQTLPLHSLSPNAQKAVAISALVVSFVALVWAVYSFLPSVEMQPNGGIGIDWIGAFRPAVRLLLRFGNPYTCAVYNPPWILFMLSPVALLSPTLGAAVMYALGLFAFAFSAYRFGVNPLVTVAFLSLPFVWWNSANGNVDWVVAVGATLPPQIGLFFVLAKPQIGMGIAAFWFFQAWRKGRFPEVVRIFAPVGTAFLLSFAAYGLYPLRGEGLIDSWVNSSLMPSSLGLGLALLLSALRARKIGLSITASPFLAPYLTEHSWSMALFGLLQDPLLFSAAWIGTWIAFILKSSLF